MNEWTTVYAAPEGWLTVERTRVGQRADQWQYAVTSASVFPGVVVLATRADKALMVRSQRIAVGTEMWELPRGLGESCDLSTEDMTQAYLNAASRELQEETSLIGGHADLLGLVHPNSGLLRDVVGVVHVSEPDGHDAARDEIEEAAWWTWSELDRVVGSGRITDGFTLATMSIFRARTAAR